MLLLKCVVLFYYSLCKWKIYILLTLQIIQQAKKLTVLYANCMLLLHS